MEKDFKVKKKTNKKTRKKMKRFTFPSKWKTNANKIAAGIPTM